MGPITTEREANPRAERSSWGYVRMVSSPYVLDELVFSDGTSVELEPGEILLIVGPNSSGKSRALREIHEGIANPVSEPRAVIAAQSGTMRVDGAGFGRWLRENANLDEGLQGQTLPVPAGLEQLVNIWDQGVDQMGVLKQLIALLANTEGRLGLTGSMGSFDTAVSAPSGPLQTLYLRDDLEALVSDASLRAFEKPLVLNRVAGSQIHLHIGQIDPSLGPPLPTNQAYRDAIRQLPHVTEEGDGFRSYVGLLLSVLTGRYPIVLIDEPEAFLHPPQARELGRELTRHGSDDTQLIAATHSADFVQSVLDAGDRPITIVRLTRDTDEDGVEINRASVLSKERLADLWADPLLRYSGLLDGLFHNGVVLCEGDSDCRFYQATLDAVIARSDRPQPDLLFAHTTGKHRLRSGVRALRAVDVPVQVIADFDLLAEEKTIKELVAEMGGKWDDYQRDWRVVASAADQMGSRPSVTAVKEELGQILKTAAGALTKDLAKQVRDATRIEDGWRRVKAGGVNLLPQGDAVSSAENLLASLKTLGIHVVPVGELERWAPEIGSHGPTWVASALEQGAHQREDAAAIFVEGLLEGST
jgi:energy-coupling factor transporter ATP-binding protein EcfA2